MNESSQDTLDLVGGELRIVAVADTHSKMHARALDRIRERKPHVILHGGDIGDLGVLDELRSVAPVTAVRGNIDALGLPDFQTLAVRDEGQTITRILLTHIALYGPKLRAEVRRRAEAAKAQLVVCGHSHVPFLGRDRGLTVFNPGSIGPRRFTLPIVFGEIGISRRAIEIRHIDCESGERWLPPRPPS